MAATQKKPTPEKIPNSAGNAITESGPHSGKIDRTAPAGSENSLGAESVRDGRPNTDDSTVEAIDEESPGAITPLATEKTSRSR
jgi:hypothetical protein